MPEVISFDALARRYCDRQDMTPAGLLAVLRDQKARDNPEGWFLSECQMIGSSAMGELTIIVFGPNNTLKAIPDRPFSPRGLASDMAVAVAWLPAADLPETLPASLADWTAPPPPPKTRRKAARR